MTKLEEINDYNRERLLKIALEDFKSEAEAAVASLDRLSASDWHELWIENSADYTCSWSKYLSVDMTDCVKWFTTKDIIFKREVISWLTQLLSVFNKEDDFSKTETIRLSKMIEALK